jgi:uncharacterized protein YuzE
MRDRYLEVTFRKGSPIAAYLYLPRARGVHSARTETAAPGIMVDFGPDGNVIGIEITSLRTISLDTLNAVLNGIGHAPFSAKEIRPLQTA